MPTIILLLILATATTASAQSLDARLWQDLRWRMIGPHRASRTKAAAGVPDQPNLFFVGVVNGGVWKTDDAGRTWTPIFDDQPTGSIGAIAIAPSDPAIIYVGSGEGLQRPDLSTGDGIYKSVDGGETWRHLGLRDGQQIPQIIVDPRDPDRLFVAVLGHPYGPNEERGIFRSTDGGQTFEKVLYRDADTGGADIVFDPLDPDIIYAVLWEARQGPWENGVFSGPGSGIHKSNDGGTTWRPLTRGLPTFADDGLGRIGITVAPSEPRRLFATVEASRNGGLYRSDDAGESWTRINDDPRVVQRASDFAEVKVHPTNPDIVFTGTIIVWKSTDGGRTFTEFRGAPGGDDYHRIWINPDNPDIMLFATDQGVIITVNGGRTFSSWYNQPTAQFYHVTTDNAFPYRVCGGQQESGSACVSSRGDDGQITFREWHPVGVEEYGYVAPDPRDPDIVYGGKVSRYDRRTGQVQNITPVPFRSADYRVLRTAPILFSPVDSTTLYFASNTLWKTTNGGTSWQQISPDLTRRDSIVPANVGKYAATPEARARHPGVIYTIAPSYVDADWIWVGTDDGLMHVTSDGGQTWREVTPPDLRSQPWSKISIMDAGRFDTLTAYAAVNTFRLDDLRPHIYRTHDGGRTWTRIVNGIPDGGTINVVREDPVRRGLLFAGSEREVYFSIDDGANWQSVRLNMPATSIRDLVIKDDDVVVGTHGRSFWILDDITPLRQIDTNVAAAGALLFRPQTALRVRWNKNTDTPLPQEEPAGQNPPDGAILNYWLGTSATSVKLEVLDARGAVVRAFSSAATPQPRLEGLNVPPYWIRPPQLLAREPGMHRFVWDLHLPPPATLNFSYPIAAIYGNTARVPVGPWVMPGDYTVQLTVDGRVYTQPLTVRMDPRVRTPVTDLAVQFEQSMNVYEALQRNRTALDSVRAQGGDRARTELEGSLTRLNGELTTLLNLLQGADVAPTTQAQRAVDDRISALARLLAR
jgi:photosystem II stability/assembly factor-like uncharacterized protein